MPVSKRTSLQIATALASLPDMHRVGLPAKDSIVGLTMPTSGAQYTVIHTNETDAYDEATKGAVAAPVGDDYSGTARKAAKLSISAAKVETFKDVKGLIESLTPDNKMVARKPAIGTGSTSNRVKEEERNVQVTGFLYAASREADNDFHLIIGRDPKTTPEMYMTMELSGLPPANSSSFAKLKAARDAFKTFFQIQAGGKLPTLTYDFYQPPIPVRIEGSLFFDMTHALGPHPGPPSLKSRMPVIWEVHPITGFNA